MSPELRLMSRPDEVALRDWLESRSILRYSKPTRALRIAIPRFKASNSANWLMQSANRLSSAIARKRSPPLSCVAPSFEMKSIKCFTRSNKIGSLSLATN